MLIKYLFLFGICLGGIIFGITFGQILQSDWSINFQTLLLVSLCMISIFINTLAFSCVSHVNQQR